MLIGGSCRNPALPRQRTLPALRSVEFDLPQRDQEKALLLQLSVFAGGWSLEAAEKVRRRGSIGRVEMLDLLTSLQDKSLVVYEEQRREPLSDARNHRRQRQAGREWRGRHIPVSQHRDFLGMAENANEKSAGRTVAEQAETEHTTIYAVC